MLGGSNQDYERVRVSARTAFASTAILTLTLGAATARERVPRPTAAGHRRATLPFFFLPFSFIFFIYYPAFGATRFVSLWLTAARSCSFSAFPSLARLLSCSLVPLHFSLSPDSSGRHGFRERVQLVLSRERAQRCRSAAAAIDVGCIRNFDTRRLLSLARARASRHPFSVDLTLAFFSLSPSEVTSDAGAGFQK